MQGYKTLRNTAIILFTGLEMLSLSPKTMASEIPADLNKIFGICLKKGEIIYEGEYVCSLSMETSLGPGRIRKLFFNFSFIPQKRNIAVRNTSFVNELWTDTPGGKKLEQSILSDEPDFDMIPESFVRYERNYGLDGALIVNEQVKRESSLKKGAETFRSYLQEMLYHFSEGKI